MLKKITCSLLCLSAPLYAETDAQMQKTIADLQRQTRQLQVQLRSLQKQVHAKPHTVSANKPAPKVKKKAKVYHSSKLSVHTPEGKPDTLGFYPTALVADHRVVTYIAGTPVVTSPYLGSRPAFDGSDYIVNISSINRDIRLMQQRRRLYRAYSALGYVPPEIPIIAISGKVEPTASANSNYAGNRNADFNLGSSEIDFAAILNQNVEAYVGVAYDSSPPPVGPRINNSAFNLNMGFVNIGNLERTPFYFTGGQLYVPFGRYSSSLISAPLPMQVTRTKTRPFILGYKSQEDWGPFAAIYGYRSDTTLGKSGVGGVNAGYIFKYGSDTTEIGASFISSINDAAGMQNTATGPGNPVFGGFGSFTNGSEFVRKTRAMDAHANVGLGPFLFAFEWAGAIQAFRAQDLSFNGRPARPQAGQSEADVTFTMFNRPASFGVTYQWTKEALALRLPERRMGGVFSISIWKDTVESLEYKHDWDYRLEQFANGAAPPGVVNANTLGTGQSSDTVSVQIGVYF